jgi:hypothetical protein
MDHPQVTLATIAKGAAEQLFEKAQREVLDNIRDANTDAEQKRTITLTIEYHPDERREGADVIVKIASKLASIIPSSTRIYIGGRPRERYAVEHDPKQMGLDIAPPGPVAISDAKKPS